MKTLKLFLSIAILKVVWALPASSSSATEEVGDFISCNADKYVNIIHFDDSNALVIKELWSNLALKKGIYVTTKKLSLNSQEKEKPATFNVIVLSPPLNLESSVNRSLQLMRNFTVKSFLLYLPSQLSQDQWETMTETISAVRQNALFYVAELKNDGSLAWKKILTINHQAQVVINDLKFVGKIFQQMKTHKSEP